MASDAMLGELYQRAFQKKHLLENFKHTHKDIEAEPRDRLRQVALAESRLLSELIVIRTDQIRNGTS